MQGPHLIHAGFLAAGLAVALPIVIHLLFRQRTRTVPIGSVRFLHQVVREHRRRRRVRQWLLLALRMLAVLLLALLFARPYWDRSHLRGLEQEVVLLVDRSASMQAKVSQRESVFERARATARDELSRLDENVIVHFAVCDATGVQELPVEKLRGVLATQAATDFGLALSWARDVLGASNRAVRRIVLVTDMQRTGLPRMPFERLPDRVELAIRDVSDSLPSNVAIESVHAIRTEIRPDRPVSVRVLLRNHGPLPVRKLLTKCDVETAAGSPFQVERQTDIPGNGIATLDFPLSIETDGVYKGRVTIAVDDALSLDDQRWFAFEARHPDRILLVDGQAGRSIFSNETYFLETALRLQTEEASGQIRSFDADRIVWEAGEGFPRLDGYRAIVLANVRRLSTTDGQRLNSYIRDGGSLLIFAGEQVDAKSLVPLQERGLMPGKVADTPIQGRLRIDHWDAKHSALACFADPQQGDLRRVEFHKLLPLASLEPESHELLRVGNQIVAAERSLGRGRCVYFGSTTDRDWTELPRTPMYVPLMRQLMAYLTDQLAERSLVVNRLVEKPDETTGISQAPGDEGRWLVVNLDPRESALQRTSVDELQKLAGGASTNDKDENQAAIKLAMPADSLRSDEIWTSVAWLLLLILAAETLLAGRVHA